MKITYFGHSAFLTETTSQRFLIDPFLNGNPLSPRKYHGLKCDYILLTHAHMDHFGDTVEIAKENPEAFIVATWELAQYCAAKGLNVLHMNLGGKMKLGSAEVQLTIAHHSSSLPLEDGQTGQSLYLGNPAGIILKVDGFTLYHAGDTSIFLDMKLIGEMNSIDVAMLPIGDIFTMGIDEAVKAAEFLKPKLVVPIHYNTFEPIRVDATDFAKKVEKVGIKSKILNPGEVLTL